MTDYFKQKIDIVPTKRKVRGFTIIELLISVAVLAVVVSIALPSMSTFIQRQRISTSSQAISTAFSLARSEALNRVANIDVCWAGATAGNNTVRSFDVLPGQMVVLTTDDPAIEISSLQYDTGNLALSDNEGANPCVTFTAQGRIDLTSVATAQLVFLACLPGGDEDFSKSITVQLAGRPIVIENDSLAEADQLDCV